MTAMNHKHEYFSTLRMFSQHTVECKTKRYLHYVRKKKIVSIGFSKVKPANSKPFLNEELLWEYNGVKEDDQNGSNFFYKPKKIWGSFSSLRKGNIMTSTEVLGENWAIDFSISLTHAHFIPIMFVKQILLTDLTFNEYLNV